MRKALLLCTFLAAACTSVKEPVYKDATADIEDRVEDLIGRMTLEEKILQLNQFTLGVNNPRAIARKSLQKSQTRLLPFDFCYVCMLCDFTP